MINELRVGNYIIDNFDKDNKIEIVDLDLFQVINNFNRCGSPYPIQPIPLTEDWLIRFGFDKTSGWDDYEGYILNDVEINMNEYGYDFTNCINKPILYVHQLQNLYFALTGTELLNKC